MKLATFSDGRGSRCGIVSGGRVADLAAVEGGHEGDMRSLLAGGDPARFAERAADAPSLALEDVRLEPPVRPSKFIAIGLNSRDHRGEITLGRLLRNPALIRFGLGVKLAHPRSRYPVFFAKATSCITGPYDEIYSPAEEPSADYEGELCAVIGRRCRRVEEEGAQAAIAGYMITNDVSVRGWQFDSPMGPILAKGFDTHGPIGPWIVTADEFDPTDFELRTFVNGERRQHGKGSSLIHGPAEVVAILSRFCTLEPGDLIALGTFAGVAMLDRNWLEPGDVVRVEIGGIGHIENRVVAEPVD